MNALVRVESFFVELFQFGLSRFGEVGPRVDEFVVGYFDEAEGFGIEIERGALLVDSGNTFKEFSVEVDCVLMGGQFGSFDALDLLEGGVGVGASDSIEGCVGSLEEPTALFQSDEGVVEGGRSGVVGDSLNLGELLHHAGFHGRLVVGVFDLVERGSLEWQGAGGVEGVGGAEVSRSSMRRGDGKHCSSKGCSHDG